VFPISKQSDTQPSEDANKTKSEFWNTFSTTHPGERDVNLKGLERKQALQLINTVFSSPLGFILAGELFEFSKAILIEDFVDESKEERVFKKNLSIPSNFIEISRECKSVYSKQKFL